MPLVTTQPKFGNVKHNDDLLQKPTTSPATFKDIYSSGSENYDKFLRRDPDRFRTTGFSTEEIPTAVVKIDDSDIIDAIQNSLDDRYVNINGDAMTGFLSLVADPTADLHAVTKQYVDAAITTSDLWDRNSTTNVLSPQTTGDGVSIAVPTATREALILKSTDDDATKNLFEVQDSSGGVLSNVTSAGFFRITPTDYTAALLNTDSNSAASGIPQVKFDNTNGTVSYLQFYNSTTGNNELSDGFTFGQNGLNSILFNREAGTMSLGTSNTTRISILANGRVGINDPSPSATFEVDTLSSSTIGQIIKAAASQTANLTEWQDSSGANLSFFDNLGGLVIGDTAQSNGSVLNTKRTVTDATAGQIFVSRSYLVSTPTDDAARTPTSQSVQLDLSSASSALTNTTAKAVQYVVNVTGGNTIGSVSGMFMQAAVAATGDTTTGIGGEFQAITTESGTVTSLVAAEIRAASIGIFKDTNVINKYGARTKIDNNVVISGTVATANAYGYSAEFESTVLIGGTATITNAYGYYYKDGADTSGTITNLYGIYLEDVDNGATINSAITTNAGDVVFNEGGDANTDFRVEGDTDANLFFADAGNDAITIGGTTELGKFGIEGNADEVQFAIRANASQTANLQEWQDSSGNVLAKVDNAGNGFFGSGEAGALTIGDGTAGIDYQLKFDGETNDGLITWMEDEDRFDVADTVKMDLNVIYDPSATQNITAGGGITVTNEYMRIQGSGGAVTITANPQIAAGTDGQALTLIGRSDTNTVTLNNGNGIHLRGQAVLGLDDAIIFRYNSSDSEWHEISRNFALTDKSWSFSSPQGATGTFYVDGWYEFGASDDTFNPSITLGTVNKSEAAHFFLVQAAGGGGGTDTVIRVTGTTIDDNGTRSTAQTVDITVDNAGAAGTYYETEEKWLGQITIAKLSGPDLLCNYGFVKYWDNNNNDFIVKGFESTWLGGANDNSTDIILRHHKATGWTYNIGAAPTPPPAIAQMTTDHSTDNETRKDEQHAWKRTNLGTAINGAGSEGTIIEMVTGSNLAIERGTFLMTIRPD